MMAPSISMVPIALPSALMARAKIAAVSPSAVTLLRTIEMVAGVMPSLGPGKDADVHAPMLGDDRAALVVAVVIGAVAAGLGIAGYGLDNGVADVDMATRDRRSWRLLVEIATENLPSASASTSRAVLDDDVVPVGEEGAGLAAASALARTVTVAPSSVTPL